MMSHNGLLAVTTRRAVARLAGSPLGAFGSFVSADSAATSTVSRDVGILGREFVSLITMGRMSVDLLSTRLPHLIRVLLVSPWRDVRRVTAGPVVTGMAGLQGLSVRTTGEGHAVGIGPRLSMGQRANPITFLRHPVSMTTDPASPRPAGIWATAAVDAHPEPRLGIDVLTPSLTTRGSKGIAVIPFEFVVMGTPLDRFNGVGTILNRTRGLRHRDIVPPFTYPVAYP